MRPFALLSCLVMLACSSSNDALPPTDAGADGAEVGPKLATVGEDLDERTPRALTPTYTLPKQFYTALDELKVAPTDLSFPDIGLTFAKDSTRLHWTDALRHQGDLAPGFASMAASDVETAVGNKAPEKGARELLVAQAIYGQRDGYVVTRFDRAISVAAEGQPLLDALQTFYTHAPVAGGAVPDASWDDVRPAVAEQVSRFSLKAQIAIAQCLRGLLLAAELRDQAFTKSGALTMDQWAAQSVDYWKKRLATSGHGIAKTLSEALDYETMSRAGQIAVRSVESMRLALKDEPLATGVKLDLVGPLGRVTLSLEPKDDTWSGADFFLLLDGGGNDTYLDDTAANLDIFHPVTAVVDLAGNDTYKPSTAFDISAGKLPNIRAKSSKQAAGMFGIAVLDDAAGDDSYQCLHFCQGYGLFGVGVLIDRGGKDAYRGYDFSQGAAEYGYGLLLDTGGTADTYETLQTSQGYGGTRGIGWLVDDGGNDEYLALEDPIVVDWAGEGTNWSGSQGFGFGTRLFASGSTPAVYLSGGMGGLFDLGGDDKFKCAVMCQGFGYFFGTGVFYDKGGNDQYVVSHKYGIGGATHQSVGVFMDGGGADSYTYLGHGSTGGGEGVGLGYDLGVAFHIDRGNEPDVYRFPADIGWIMGFARHPALGVLINEGGDDEYHVTGASGDRAFGVSELFTEDRSTGLGTLKTPSVGMFLDLGGTKDVYDVTHAGIGNGKRWLQTTPVGTGWKPELDHGYGFDSE